jgi:hypothetical protein
VGRSEAGEVKGVKLDHLNVSIQPRHWDHDVMTQSVLWPQGEQ